MAPETPDAVASCSSREAPRSRLWLLGRPPSTSGSSGQTWACGVPSRCSGHDFSWHPRLPSFVVGLRLRGRPARTEELILPEGHTIHRLARDLKRGLGGAPLEVSSPQGRFAEAAVLLDGSRLERTDAHGKHLFLGFEGQRWVHVHLGLYGKFTIGTRPEPDPRGALRLRLLGASHWADLRGATACELVTAADKRVIHDRLGPDPLRRDADPQRAWLRLSRSRVSLAALLMDQAVVAGIGNVFRAEVLFRQRLDPYGQGRALGRERFDAVWGDLSAMLTAGVRAGRIVTTLPEHRQRPRGPVLVEDAHYVYRRAGRPCRICGTPIHTVVVVGRNLFWCPVCQVG